MPLACESERMIGEDLKVANGTNAGAWIEPRLGGKFGAVTLHVPSGFEAYARVFHPPADEGQNPVRWTDVANALGGTAHREMQWYSLLGVEPYDDSKWPGSPPSTGEMDLDELDALCAILATHRTDPMQCFFGLSTIPGWEDMFTVDELWRGLLRLPDRDYIVIEGPLSAVDRITFDASKSSSTTIVSFSSKGDGPPPNPDPSLFISRRSPNLIWPADRAWFVISEVDFDSTLVGGTAALIDAMVSSPDLEAWQVGETTSLAYDADRINGAEGET